MAFDLGQSDDPLPWMMQVMMRVMLRVGRIGLRTLLLRLRLRPRP